MTTHSPGPWTMPYPRMGFSEIRDANGDLVFGVAAGLENEKRPDDVIDANAALILAAPEMYVALCDLRVIAEQNINDICASIQEGDGVVSSIERMELARWSNALAALEKVERHP